ncbi:hypothetical protein [Butyrivibrio sp. AE2015]|uniref:hypothetical protein n=1 Tax=Butyrivibrio sp. AE2015 TaxID=1280663 RepID=UPI0003B4D2ED|nr:hypothetical protein [Butyrivibrio sp. AE2015]
MKFNKNVPNEYQEREFECETDKRTDEMPEHDIEGFYIPDELMKKIESEVPF